MSDLKNMVRFLTGPHAGLSAKAICRQAISNEIIPNAHYPHDSGDFMRCHICLEETGIDIGIMRGVSPVWDAMVDRWGEISEAYVKEKDGRSGPETYRIIREVIDGVREKG